MRQLFSAMIVASMVACSPSERGIGYSDPVQMAMLKMRMHEQQIPFREGEGGMLLYKPQYHSQISAIATALQEPYVDSVFEDAEYQRIYLAQLKVMDRVHYLYTAEGKHAVRWWKKEPRDLETLHERISAARQAAHPATGRPCDKAALPSNSAAHADARASVALSQPPSTARAGGCGRYAP